jgi:DNA polymerase-1
MGRHLLPDPNESEEHRRWNWFQAAVNFLIQGSCADVLKVAMVKLPSVLPSSARLLLTVHDELVLECPACDAQITAHQTSQVMKEAFREVFGDVVPIEVEVSICNNWAEK